MRIGGEHQTVSDGEVVGHGQHGAVIAARPPGLAMVQGPGARKSRVEDLLNELVAGAAARTVGQVDAALLEVEGAHVAGLDGAHGEGDSSVGTAEVVAAVVAVGARWRP